MVYWYVFRYLIECFKTEVKMHVRRYKMLLVYQGQKLLLSQILQTEAHSLFNLVIPSTSFLVSWVPLLTGLVLCMIFASLLWLPYIYAHPTLYILISASPQYPVCCERPQYFLVMNMIYLFLTFYFNTFISAQYISKVLIMML